MAYTKKNQTAVKTKVVAAQAKEDSYVKDTDIEHSIKIDKTEKRKYEPTDLILCRSMYAGTLLFSGDKTKMVYEFSNIGDVRYIEYQDLLSAFLLRKKSLFAPYIIIEDEELLSDVHWSEIKSIYEGMYTKDDLMALINLPTSQFETEFKRLPIGFKTTIATIVSQMISDGTFDSLNKINIIDGECGTDLRLLADK